MGLLQSHERHRRGARPLGLRRKAVVFHSLGHAVAAMRAAEALRAPLVLMSGPGAAGYAGASWFLEVLRQAHREHPGVNVTAVLDCADAPGRALAALRHGVKVLRLGGDARARARVAAVAEQMGARLDDARYALLDLGAESDPERAARKFLKP